MPAWSALLCVVIQTPSSVHLGFSVILSLNIQFFVHVVVMVLTILWGKSFDHVTVS